MSTTLESPYSRHRSYKTNFYEQLEIKKKKTIFFVNDNLISTMGINMIKKSNTIIIVRKIRNTRH